MAEQNDRFVRWQKISVDYLGICNNVILVLTIGALSYSLALTQDKNFTATRAIHARIGIVLIVALGALCLSALLGLLCMLNRMRDFRGTAQRAKDSEKALSKEGLEQIGKLTWWLFYGQSWLFISALTCLGIVVWYTFIAGLISS
jgi:hypothetical protein